MSSERNCLEASLLHGMFSTCPSEGCSQQSCRMVSASPSHQCVSVKSCVLPLCLKMCGEISVLSSFFDKKSMQRSSHIATRIQWGQHHERHENNSIAPTLPPQPTLPGTKVFRFLNNVNISLPCPVPQTGNPAPLKIPRIIKPVQCQKVIYMINFFL